jgi:tetratricopeptide (TPR) repeat protein
LTEFQAAIAIRPHFADGEQGLARAYESMGNNPEALTHWRNAHVIDPNLVSAIVGLAWIRATAPEAAVRSGAEAVSLAESAKNLAPADDPEVLDTLAAAYAEEGQFGRAITSATRALHLAATQGNSLLTAAIRGRLALYRENRPFRSGRPTDVAQPSVAATQSSHGER